MLDAVGEEVQVVAGDICGVRVGEADVGEDRVGG